MTDTVSPASSGDEDQLETAPAPCISMERDCLRCQSKFSSEWAGERVCGRCKSSSAWKQGTPVSVHGSGGGRR